MKTICRISSLIVLSVSHVLILDMDAFAAPKPKHAKTADVARILEVKGRVLYRRKGEYIFTEVRRGQVLARHTTLFTDEDGWVTLAFAGDQSAAVSVPPNSIYRLDSDLPLSMLMRRGFTRSKVDFMADKIKSNVLSKESKVLVSGIQDTGEITQSDSGDEISTRAVRFGVRMAFEMKRIPIVFPLNNVFTRIESATGRASVPIVLAGERDDELQAFLWRVKPDTKVVWSGLFSKKTDRIVMSLDKSGVYVFQAFGVKGLSRTRSVRITVTESQDTALLPPGIVTGDSVLFH